MVAVILLSLGLALDALSVSIIEGALIRSNRTILAFKLALVFGFFQAKMAAIGFIFGEVLVKSIYRYAHVLTPFVFMILGLKMLKVAFKEENYHSSRMFSWKSLIILGIATSIDALAAGFTLPMMTMSPAISVLMIGMITFVLCFVGAYFGSYLKIRFTKIPLEAVGGVLLIILGIQILLTSW